MCQSEDQVAVLRVGRTVEAVHKRRMLNRDGGSMLCGELPELGGRGCVGELP
jgi:hypothetical protein